MLISQMRIIQSCISRTCELFFKCYDAEKTNKIWHDSIKLGICSMKKTPFIDPKDLLKICRLGSCLHHRNKKLVTMYVCMHVFVCDYVLMYVLHVSVLVYCPTYCGGCLMRGRGCLLNGQHLISWARV